MYIENFDTSRRALASPAVGKRSLASEFVFISQDDSVSYAAESCIDTLRGANRILGHDAYRWAHVRGAAGLADLDGPACGPNQTLVLIGGLEAAWQPEGQQLQALRAAIRNAARVCVVGAAVFVPLRAGVLGAKRVAVHPNFRPGVMESPTHLELHEGPTCHHNALSSAISPAAAMRMMVELVGARDGEFTRAALAKYLGLSEPESPNMTGEHWHYTRLAQGDAVIGEALSIMLDHLEDTLTVGQIAGLLDVSPRKLERGFRDLLQQTPLKVYRDLRLDRARRLMSQTSMPMNEISFACGFSNVTLMKKWFTQKYSETPEQVRQHAYHGMLAA